MSANFTPSRYRGIREAAVIDLTQFCPTCGCEATGPHPKPDAEPLPEPEEVIR